MEAHNWKKKQPKKNPQITVKENYHGKDERAQPAY